MAKRFVIVGAATAVAGLVLLLSLLAGSPDGAATDERPRADERPVDAVPFLGHETIADPDTFGRDQLTRGAQGGTYVFEDDADGRRTVLTYRLITPQPQSVYDVVDPAARTWFSPRQAMTVHADRGSFTAPENKLRQGAFQGNVVLTFYETDGSRAPDLDSDRDVAVRVFLDHAEFDVDLANIESAGPIHVTGPRVDFFGRGLSLVYNDQHNRIQKLIVFEGESLRFKLEDANPDPTPAPPAADRGQTPTTTPDGEPAPAASSTAAANPQATPAPDDVQFYRARFEEGVTVTGSPDRVDMAADYLTAIFSLDAGSEAEEDEPAPADATAAHPPASAPPTVSAAGAPGAPPPPASAETVQRSLCPISDDDVIIRWTGRLVLEPEMSPPADLAGPRDLFVQLAGSPLTIATAAGETVTGHTADYLASTARVRALGDGAFPMKVTSPQLGALTGTEVAVDQRRGVGYVLGPGTLVGDPAENPGLRAQWADRLDLTFYRSQDPAAGDPLSPADRVDALASAVFRGDVAVTDPRFNLAADRSLTLRLTDPVDGDQALEQITAAGNVRLKAANDAGESLAIDGQSLDIDLAADAQNNPFPTRVQAAGDVRAQVPNLTLTSQTLDVALSPPTDSDEGDDQPIETLIATGDVKVNAEDPEAVLTGDRLVADAAADQLELFGDEQAPAVADANGAVVRGRHLIMVQKDQSLFVKGPGSFDAPLDPDAPDQRLTVAWTDGMNFHNLPGQAAFHGGVVAETKDGFDVTQLRSGDLQLQLTPAEPEAGGEASSAPASALAGGDPRTIQQLVATSDVVFTSVTYPPVNPIDVRLGLAPAEPEQPATRLTLKGPSLTFTNDPDAGVERIDVPGPGLMLLEDYRPADGADPGPASDNPAPLASFTGRGATLFVWSQRQVLDVAANDMTLTGNVTMRHNPIDNPPDNPDGVLQLDADRLLVDLSETGGLAGLSGDADAGPAAQPEVENIEADGNVRITETDRTITADRLRYAATDRIAKLLADPGRVAEVVIDGQPTTLRARELWWHVDRNRFEIKEPAGGVIPIPR